MFVTNLNTCAVYAFTETHVYARNEKITSNWTIGRTTGQDVQGRAFFLVNTEHIPYPNIESALYIYTTEYALHDVEAIDGSIKRHLNSERKNREKFQPVAEVKGDKFGKGWRIHIDIILVIFPCLHWAIFKVYTF